MSEIKPYIPIDCNFYDRLEAWSVRHESVSIQLIGEKREIVGHIKDLYIRDKVEFLLLNTGMEIRLDRISSVNNIPLEVSCDI